MSSIPVKLDENLWRTHVEILQQFRYSADRVSDEASRQSQLIGVICSTQLAHSITACYLQPQASLTKSLSGRDCATYSLSILHPLEPLYSEPALAQVDYVRSL